MVIRRIILGLPVFVALVAVSFLSLGSRSAFSAEQPQPQQTFDAAVIAKGAQLAAIGNCATCHTKHGGKAFAGGRPLSTPFGTIYSTNITPDPETGIGTWSEADFQRAMHDGVGRDARQLYPAFPYDHFTKVTDDDVSAIYAFVMTRDAVHAQTPPNKLLFPMNLRPTIAAWKMFFFKRGVFQPDPSKSEQWNRGAYLVEGLGHCGACHTPRNVFGAEKRGQDFFGGEAEGWHATALNSASPAPVRWTDAYVLNYLRDGRDELHGVAVGPMAPVVHNLSRVAEQDVRAIATYVASMTGEPTAAARSTSNQNAVAAKVGAQDVISKGSVGSAAESQGEAATREGASIFAGACASCHMPGGMTIVPKPVDLELSSAITAPDPRNLIHIVVEGIWPSAEEKRSVMPGFAGALTDEQVVALVSYIRERFSDRPAWRDVPQQVHKIARKEAL